MVSATRSALGFANPFPDWLNAEIRNIRNSCGPDAAEKRMASDCHDYLDAVWDDLTSAEKQYAEGFFAWLLYLVTGWISIQP